MSAIPDLLQFEKEYVLDHYQTSTVQDMATHLKRGMATINAFLKARELTAYRKPMERRANSHPFRAKNRQLEAVVLQRRIDNRKANPKGGKRNGA